MIQAKVQISSVDYEKTVRALFPTVMGKLAAKKPGSPLVKLMAGLGGDAEALVLDYLHKTPAALLQDAVCQLTDSYKNTLTEKVNGIVDKSEFAGAVHIGLVRVEKNGEGYTLCADDVDADVKTLLASPAVQSKIKGIISAKAGDGIVGKMAVKAVEGVLSAVGGMSREKAEKTGTDLLSRPEISEKLLSAVQKKLTAKGISAVLGGLSMSCGAAVGRGSGAPDGLKLSDDLIRSFTAATSGYIRGLLK